MALGWVYVLSNDAMPGLIKIGQSAADPDVRAVELFTTGVPRSFVVEYKGLYDGYALLERVVHNDLAQSRSSMQREFFSVSAEVAVERIRALASSQAKYEECHFQPSKNSYEVEDKTWTPIKKAEQAWVAAERARRRDSALHMPSEIPPPTRILNCRECGAFVRPMQVSCARCDASVVGY